METVGKMESLWGEGPVWHDGFLYYVDIEGCKVCRVHPGTGQESFTSTGERVGFVAPREAGGFVIGGDSGLNFFDFETGEKTFIVDPEPGKKPDNRFNDGKCDPAGRIWAGTISTVKKTGDAALYCLGTGLDLTMKIPGVTNSNGLCWSKDATTFYYIDTPTKKVRAYDYDKDTGAITGERVAIDTAELSGSPDGMTIDGDDRLWIAFCRAGRVRCFEPTSGGILEEIKIPVSGVTSCTFGGAELDMLFVTTGQFLGVSEPGAGLVYACQTGARGRIPVPFGG